MKSSFRLFRIAGFDIGIHYSWFFILLLVTWSLAQGYFPQTYPNWTTSTYWVMGALAAILLFVSVLVHELAHSVIARSKGLPVSSITLFLLGGVSNLQEEPKDPGVEFIMSLSGPLTSLIIAGVFGGIYLILGKASTAGALSWYLAYLNLTLGIFNLIPGFPLDGGRVLRSIIWKSTGNVNRATDIATVIGQIFGWGLILFGFMQLIAGNIIGGLWIAFIGWFLNNTADASRKEVSFREHLSNVRVKEVMKSAAPTVGPDVSVEEAVTGIVHGKYGRAIPVIESDRLLGIVTMKDIKGLSKDKWLTTRIGQIMTRSPLEAVTPEDTLDAALNLLGNHDINQIIVSQDGRYAGIITRADIINYLQLSRELGRKPGPARSSAG